MADIPRITVSSDDVVVDDVQPCRRLFRPARWRVVWRSLHDADLSGETLIARHDRNGRGALGEEQFNFSIRWCTDRRRPLLFSNPVPLPNLAQSQLPSAVPVLVEVPAESSRYF